MQPSILHPSTKKILTSHCLTFVRLGFLKHEKYQGVQRLPRHTFAHLAPFLYPGCF